MLPFLPNSRVFGLALTDHAVRVCFLGSDITKRRKILGFNELTVEKSPFLKNSLRSVEDLTETIRRALEEAKPRPIEYSQAAISLPESVVFSKVIKLPKLSNKELNQTIPFEAGDFLPLPLDETYLDWQVSPLAPGEKGDSKGDQTHVLVVAVPKKIIDDLMVVANNLNLKIKSIETQPFSTLRGVRHLLKERDTAVIVSVAHELTTLIIATPKAVRFVATAQIGARRLRQSPKISTSNLCSEIEEGINYYHNRISDQEQITRLILVGEGSLIAGLDTELQATLKIPCEIGYPPITLPNNTPIHPRFIPMIGVSMWHKGR